jgi:hypothetical protein
MSPTSRFEGDGEVVLVDSPDGIWPAQVRARLASHAPVPSRIARENNNIIFPPNRARDLSRR